MGTWTRIVRATSVAHSGESAVAICDRAAKGAQTAVVASQVAEGTSASGIATGESGTTVVRSAAVALALTEAAHDHVEAAMNPIQNMNHKIKHLLNQSQQYQLQYLSAKVKTYENCFCFSIIKIIFHI